MKFALFGIDSETARLAREIEASGDHDVVWYCPVGDSDVSDSAFTKVKASPDDDWLVSLDRSAAEAVVVARQDDEPQLLESLRRLTEAQLPLVLSHPLNFSVMAYYEIELIVASSTASVIPLLTARWNPTVRQIVESVPADDARAAAGDTLGAVRQVEIDRAVAPGDLPTVLRSFAQDIDTIRQFAGDLTEVAAMGARGDLGEVVPIAAQMSGPKGVLARWSASSADGQAGTRMTIVGEDRKVTLEMLDGQIWQLAGADAALPSTGAGLLDGLVDRLQGPAGKRHYWRDVIQSLELTEALEKSLRRGRVVRLNLEGRSESSAFKGTMASIGCALLVATVFLLASSAVVLKFAKDSGLTWLVAIVGKVPDVLAGVFCVFLLIQLLRYLIPTKDDSALDL